MPWYSWSQTASANATADATINWAEGQAPSSINDSARAMMAATAKYRDDISGAIVTGGTSTAYTVTSNSAFDTLAHMANQIIAFTPHATNGATVTLNVDSLGAKPLRTSPGVDLLAGTLILGTPYVALYNNSDAAFYLCSFFGDRPYAVPLGAGMDYWGSTTPNSSFAFPAGQAISRATYATLFSLFSTTFGAGDGSTTFNIPDVRGRITAGKDDMGGSAASRITTAGGAVDGATLGAVGGGQSITLLTANLPAYTPAGTVATTTAGQYLQSGAGGGSVNTTGSAQGATTPIQTSTFTGTAQGGTSTAVKTLPPTIICNRILRII